MQVFPFVNQGLMMASHRILKREISQPAIVLSLPNGSLEPMPLTRGAGCRPDVTKLKDGK